MKVDGVPTRSIRLAGDGWSVEVIDQAKLPHAFEVARLKTLEDAARAIEGMVVRGAPLIGATGAYGLALALRADGSDDSLAAAAGRLRATRPTGANLAWALEKVAAAVRPLPPSARAEAAYAAAAEICEDDVATCKSIGVHGLALIEEARDRAGGGRPVEVLTHCNAGWLACVDWGTALAPVYAAHEAGLAVHVWVTETRPRNQGAGLTAWELAGHGVPHTVVADGAAGHLMARGKIDICITGTDRTAANGDVCNKIGTYMTALAAADNGVPFYVALPASTIDWSAASGAVIPIEERDAREVTHVSGLDEAGRLAAVRVTPEESQAANPAFDVTPARLVTGLITERGRCAASAEGLLGLYPERAGH